MELKRLMFYVLLRKPGWNSFPFKVSLLLFLLEAQIALRGTELVCNFSL